MRDNPFHNTKKRGKMTVKPLHRIQCRKCNRTGGEKYSPDLFVQRLKEKKDPRTAAEGDRRVNKTTGSKQCV